MTERAALSKPMIADLLAHLDRHLAETACDHTLDVTMQWAQQAGVDRNDLLDALEQAGGYCDCEVLQNLDPDPAPDTPAPGKLPRSRPRKWLAYWSIAVFLIAVGRLLLVSGISLRILTLFLVPPFMAFAFRYSQRRSTRIVAALFLTLVDLGVAIGPLRWLFPDLRHDDRLSPADGRTLAWYLLVYALYVFMVLPPFLFGRGLFTRHRQPGDFSTFTNVLGLVAWVIIGPLVVWPIVNNSGIWPPFRW